MATLKCLLLSLLLSTILAAQTASDMLERALPGVVTVAVNETSPVKKVMGVASRSDRMEKAYGRVLDLSDAAGSGSGFLIKRGDRLLIVTNAHVVEMAKSDEIYAYSINQTRYKVKVVGGDSFYDIALLEFVEPAKPGPELMPMEFRADDPRVGETIYALGNPLGEYPYSVSQGIVGGKNRLLAGLTGRVGYLQHSASIIWGNSGGPLIDSAGRVVGVNTRIEISDRGQAFLISQLNFALQGSVARRVIDSLLANHGRLNRAYLGLELTQTVPTSRFRKAVATEAVIEGVVPGSPADALAKFKGYRVDRIGSQTVRNLDEAMTAIEGLRPGETVEIEVTKDGTTETVKIQPGQLSEQNYAALANQVIATRLNFELGEQDGHVILTRERQRMAKTSSNLQAAQLGPMGKRTVIPQAPQTIGVLAVGLVPETRSDQDAAEALVYRVGTALDLGVALRLLLMAGRADLLVLPPGSDQPLILRWTLSNSSDVVVRMLIC